MFIEAPEPEVSTCWSTDPIGELSERKFDFFIASKSLQGILGNT